MMSDVWCVIYVRCLMSVVWWQTSDVWCPMFAVRHLISNMYDVWCRTFLSDARCQTSLVRCLLSDIWLPICMMSDVWHISGVCCQTSDVRCQTSDIWFQTSGVKNSDVRRLMCKICIMSDIRYQLSKDRCQTSDFRYMSDVWYIGGGGV